MTVKPQNKDIITELYAALNDIAELTDKQINTMGMAISIRNVARKKILKVDKYYQGRDDHPYPSKFHHVEGYPTHNEIVDNSIDDEDVIEIDYEFGHKMMGGADVLENSRAIEKLRKDVEDTDDIRTDIDELRIYSRVDNCVKEVGYGQLGPDTSLMTLSEMGIKVKWDLIWATLKREFKDDIIEWPNPEDYTWLDTLNKMTNYLVKKHK